jgi:hypothetical protein
MKISARLEWCVMHRPNLLLEWSEEKSLTDCFLVPSDSWRYVDMYAYMMFVLLVAQDIKTGGEIVSASNPRPNENTP